MNVGVYGLPPGPPTPGGLPLVTSFVGASQTGLTPNFFAISTTTLALGVRYHYFPMLVTAPMPISNFAFEVTTSAATSTVGFALYESGVSASGERFAAVRKVIDFGVGDSTSTGKKTLTVAATTIPPGLYQLVALSPVTGVSIRVLTGVNLADPSCNIDGFGVLNVYFTNTGGSPTLDAVLAPPATATYNNVLGKFFPGAFNVIMEGVR